MTSRRKSSQPSVHRKSGWSQRRRVCLFVRLSATTTAHQMICRREAEKGPCQCVREFLPGLRVNAWLWVCILGFGCAAWVENRADSRPTVTPKAVSSLRKPSVHPRAVCTSSLSGDCSDGRARGCADRHARALAYGQNTVLRLPASRPAWPGHLQSSPHPRDPTPPDRDRTRP